MNSDNFKGDISHIIRIQNLFLWNQNYSYEKFIGNVTIGFHGTTKKAMESIISSGWNRDNTKESDEVVSVNGLILQSKRNKGTHLYGMGSYFSKKPSLASNFSKKENSQCKWIIISKIVLGNYCKGETNFIKPPDGYNSTVDNVNNPDIYCLYHDASCYPMYVIGYN